MWDVGLRAVSGFAVSEGVGRGKGAMAQGQEQHVVRDPGLWP